MKRILIIIWTIAMLAGCGGEEIDVIKLEYKYDHWSLRDIHSGNTNPGTETWVTDLLDACSGEPISQIEEDVTVYNSYVLNRKAILSDYDPYANKLVMYMRGKKNYVVCYDEVSDLMTANKIDVLPSFVDTEKGINILSTPSIRIGTHEELKNMEQVNQGHFFERPLHLIEETVIHVTPSLYGKIDLTIGGRQGLFPLSHLEPFNAQSKEVAIALGYDEKSKEAYFYYEKADGLTTVLPLVIWNEEENKHESIQFEGLQVEQMLQVKTLEPGVETPLYTFSFMKHGKRVEEEVRLTYTNVEFATKDTVQDAIESNPAIPSGPFVFAHEKPLHGAIDIQYPNVLRAAGIDMTELMDAIDEAELVKRSGDVEEYTMLTIIDGWVGQEFQLSFKKRSKKVDVYLTDAERNQTFKLTSAGAETFFSYFPDLKE